MTAPSGPRSGKHGVVNGVGAVRNWTLNFLNAVQTHYHSATQGGPERYPGVEDWNATFEGFGGDPGIFPGEAVALKLFAGPSDGIWGSTGEVWYGAAIVDSLSITWNFQPNQSLQWAATVSANGCIAQEESEYYDTVTDTCPNQMCGLDIKYLDDCGTASDYVDWNYIESVTLTFTAANVAYVNSSTACCTYRRPGNIDWTMDIVDQEDYPVMATSDTWAFRLYTSATKYWQLLWGNLQNISNIRVDVESGAIKTKTNSIVMNGRTCCANVGTGTEPNIGSITDPGGTVVWPIALA